MSYNVVKQRKRLQTMVDILDSKIEAMARLQYSIYWEELEVFDKAGLEKPYFRLYVPYSTFDFIRIDEDGSAGFWVWGCGEPDEKVYSLDIDSSIIAGNPDSFRDQCKMIFAEEVGAQKVLLAKNKESEKQKLLARLKELDDV